MGAAMALAGAIVLLAVPSLASNLLERQTTAVASEGATLDRLETVATDFLREADRVPLFGLGLGAGTNVANFLNNGRTDHVLAEYELTRVVQELGPVFGLFYIAVRWALLAWFVALTLREARRGNLQPACFIGFLTPVFLAHDITLQNTMIGIGWFAAGVFLAAVEVGSTLTSETAENRQLRPEHVVGGCPVKINVCVNGTFRYPQYIGCYEKQQALNAFYFAHRRGTTAATLGVAASCRNGWPKETLLQLAFRIAPSRWLPACSAALGDAWQRDVLRHWQPCDSVETVIGGMADRIVAHAKEHGIPVLGHPVTAHPATVNALMSRVYAELGLDPQQARFIDMPRRLAEIAGCTRPDRRQPGRGTKLSRGRRRGRSDRHNHAGPRPRTVHAADAGRDG